MSKGIISTVAGNGSAGYTGDGDTATIAELNGPQGLAVDSAGNVIIADTYNNRIRKVSGGTINTIVGNGQAGYGGDGGQPSNAKLYAPYSVALDSAGNLYIADTANNRIRMVSASTGSITTIAGSGTAGFSGDYGPATAAQLNQPFAVAVDSTGRVYVADNANNAVRVLTPAVSTCTYALTGGTSQAAAAGGNETLSVQTTAFCPWTIADLPAWITVYGLPDGTGPGSATLVLAANTGAARSATITIAGQNVTITQGGAIVGPAITQVANAEGEVPMIAPNTWVEIKSTDLAPAGDSRPWQASDFKNNQLPTSLDGVSVTVNGTPAYIYYISPTQINILTPPGALLGSVQVAVTNGTSSPAFSVPAQAASPSFFVFNGGPYVAATHVNGSLIGPTALYPGNSTPSAAGETIVVYGNGFGATSTAVTAGAESQSGTLSPLPVITIGGVAAQVQFAGLNVAPGEFQFNVVVPATLATGDQPIVATYNGLTTQTGTLVTVQ